MKLIDEDRKITYRIVLGVAATIVSWAIIHDQIIVQIAPEHFTEYHEPVGNIENAYVLALLWAIAATLGLGLILGIVYAFFGRSGDRPKVSVRFILFGTIIMVVLIELVSSGTGWWVFRTGETLYPDSWYPVDALGILVTQTMQISAYLTSAALSTAFGFWIAGKRRL